MRKLFAVLATLALTAGCRAQIPPASKGQSVALTWSAPTATSSWGGCTTSAPCVYAVYRCSAGATTCADTTNAAWAEITTATTRPSGTSYTDTSAIGLTVWYNVETVQGTQNSAPSNIAGPFSPQGPPGMPGNITGGTQTALAPELRSLGPVPAGTKELALGAPQNLRVR